MPVVLGAGCRCWVPGAGVGAGCVLLCSKKNLEQDVAPENDVTHRRQRNQLIARISAIGRMTPRGRLKHFFPHGCASTC